MYDNQVLREAGVKQITCIVRGRHLRLYERVARLPPEDPPSHSSLPRSEWPDHAKSASTGFMIASCGVLRNMGITGLTFCLFDGQTEAEGVLSQGGTGDALLRHIPLYLPLPT